MDAEKVRRLRFAAMIREQPVLWFYVLYASSFTAMALGSDLLGWAFEPFKRYVLPLIVIAPMWVSTR